MLRLTQESMRNLLTEKLTSLLLGEDVVVTSVHQVNEHFQIEFLPTSEAVKDALEKRTDLPRAEEFKKEVAKAK